MFPISQVVWEVFSYPISGKGNILLDLLFLGTFPPNVTEVPSSRRPKTGTTVLQFDGCEGIANCKRIVFVLDTPSPRDVCYITRRRL